MLETTPKGRRTSFLSLVAVSGAMTPKMLATLAMMPPKVVAILMFDGVKRRLRRVDIVITYLAALALRKPPLA